jgi:hypothetical protein
MREYVMVVEDVDGEAIGSISLDPVTEEAFYYCYACRKSEKTGLKIDEDKVARIDYAHKCTKITYDIVEHIRKDGG